MTNSIYLSIFAFAISFLSKGDFMTPVEIEHRPDQLLQGSVAEGCPPGLEDTFIGRVTQPTHEALLSFLDQKVVGRTFETPEDLREALDQWPDYAQEEHDLAVGSDFGSIDISSEGFIFCGESPGGPFVIGLIEQS